MEKLGNRRQSAKNAKAGPDLEGMVFPTDFGWAGLASTPKGVRYIVLHEPSRAHAERRLRGFGTRFDRPPAPALRRASESIAAYFAGQPARLEFPLDLSDFPPFTRKVMQATRKIGRGRVMSYGEVAAAAGSPRAARAVGAVMARNPFPLAVP